MRENLFTFTDAAEVFETDSRTISGLVKALTIEPKPTGLPGKSRGLDRVDMKRIGKALNKPFQVKGGTMATVDEFLSPPDEHDVASREATFSDTGLPPGCLDASGRLRVFTEAERIERAARMVTLFEELDRIGTPEERAETHDHLMAALAETRRAEGRVF